MENMIPRAWNNILNSSNVLPVIVKSIERIHDNRWSMDLSQHDHFEMVYMKKGSAVFEVSGEEICISPNDTILIKPHQPHKFRVKTDVICEFVVLYFTFIDREHSHISQVSLEDFIRFVKERESGPFIYIKAHPRNEIAYTLNRILREREKNEIEGEFLSYLLVMELFVLLSRVLKTQWEESIREKESKIIELMENAKKFILENYAQDIGLSDIARYVFLSPNYFARAFKEAFGISPINYLLRLRIDHARELLEKTTMKIGDIALQVGFSNQQRFNDIFKKNTGLSPLVYRKNSKRSRLNQ